MTSTHERIKTVLLVVLIVGAVFMAYSTWFYDNPMGDGALGALLTGELPVSGADYVESVGDMQEIRPLRVTVRNAAGRVGAQESFTATDAMYSSTRGLMAEALSALQGEWYAVDESVWRAALLKQGVVYDYQGVVRLDTLSRWLGANRSEASELRGRYLMLCCGEMSVQVLIKNPYTGIIYACRTQLEGGGVSNALDAVSGDACRIAAELDGTDYEKLVPETIVLEKEKPQVISGYNTASYFTREQRDDFLKSFGFTPYSVSEYVEADGTKVYIEEMTNVRLSPDGFAVYTDTQSGSEMQNGMFVQSASQDPSAAEVFDTVRAVVSRLAKLVGGEGRLYPQDFRYVMEQDSWVADFGWCVNGIPVDRGGTGYSARVVVKDLRVTEIRFYMRSYQSTGRSSDVFSQKLAAAAAQAQDGFCELELRYTDAGQSELNAAWYQKNKK